MTPAFASVSLKVVATETLSKTASTATPASISRFAQRDAELLVGLEELRIDLGEALRPVRLGLGGGVIRDRLVIDGRVFDRGPAWFLHREPVPVSA